MAHTAVLYSGARRTHEGKVASIGHRLGVNHSLHTSSAELQPFAFRCIATSQPALYAPKPSETHSAAQL